MDGVFFIDKPKGISSFDVVRAVKRHIASGEVGHAGTLDPMATGLLTVCIGQATKLVPYLMDADKEYRATICLGSATNTDDADDGSVVISQVSKEQVFSLKDSEIRRAAQEFVGTILQIPPAFSALRFEGKRLYEYAREVDSEKSAHEVAHRAQQKQRAVCVHNIDIDEIALPFIEVRISCGKGTYIRSIARDLGKKLGVFGHLSSLRRTMVGLTSLEGAYPLEFDEVWKLPIRAIPKTMVEAVSHLPTLKVSEPEAIAISQGKQHQLTKLIEKCGPMGHRNKYCSVLDEKGDLVAMLVYEGHTWRIGRGFKGSIPSLI